MALQFNASPYLQVWAKRKAEEEANRFDPNTVSQPILQGLGQLAESRRQQQLVDLQKQKMTQDQQQQTWNMGQQQRQADYEYGAPIDPNAMIASPTGQMAQSKFMPGGTGPAGPMGVGAAGMGQVATSGSLVDAFNSWRSGGMKGPGRPEFAPALGKDERKAFYDRNSPESALDTRTKEAEIEFKRSQTAKNLREDGNAEKAPPGYRFRADGSLEAIQGGPAEAKIRTAEERAHAAMNGLRDQADLVIGKVDQALGKVGYNTAGIGGSIMGMVPGSEATDLESDIDTIKAVLGFNTLAEMRRASPTGGALGAVSERELKLLTAARASLEQRQSPAQLKARLGEIKTHYQNFLDALEQEGGSTRPSGSGYTTTGGGSGGGGTEEKSVGGKTYRKVNGEWFEL